MRSPFILAVDIGAGSLRAGLVTTRGRVAAAAAIRLVPDEPRPGWCEFDPEAWWRALVAGSVQVLRRVPRGGRVLGACICGLTRTQVLLDRHGQPLGPAILFRDRRAAKIAAEMGEGVTAFDPAARLAWIARHQPARHARIAAVVEPREFLTSRLCGARATASTPWDQVGVVRAGIRQLARLSGAPVFAGAMDTWASAVGSGAVAPGHAYDVAGTSEAVGLVTATPVAVPGLVTKPWTESAHQVGGPTQAGADCARWCHDTFRLRERLEHAVERVGRRPPSDARPLFLPYLEGERAPVWSTGVRGAFHGIARGSTPDDFLWATLEGVAMAVRDILAHAQAGAALRATELRVSGGGARSQAWCRMKADVTGLPVIRSAEDETGLVGAAIAACVGLGLHASVAQAAAAMVPRVRRFAPRQANAEVYAARFAQYLLIKEAALALAAPGNE